MKTVQGRWKLSNMPMLTPRARAWAACGAAAAAAAAFVLIGHDRGYTATETPMSQGSAWLVSGPESELTLLDGAIPQVVKHSAVQNQPVGVAQEGDTAFSVDATTGTVTRVDGATRAVTHSVRLFAQNSSSKVYASPGAIYVVDAEHGQVAELDPRTLARRSNVALSTTPPQGGVVVAGDRLWLTDTTNRSLTWVRDGVATRFPQALSAPNGQLAVASGRLAAVEAETGLMEVLDSESGDIQATQRLALQRDDTVRLSGGPDGAVAVVTSGGQLIRCALTSMRCIDAVDLGTGRDQLGVPVTFQGRTYVPNYRDGNLVEVVPGAKPSARQALSHGAAYDLFEHDGYLFFNEPQGAEAGVVKADDTLVWINKFKDPPTPSYATKAGPQAKPSATPTPTSPEPTYEPTFRPADEPKERPKQDPIIQQPNKPIPTQAPDQTPTVTPTMLQPSAAATTPAPSATSATPDPSTTTDAPPTDPVTSNPATADPTTSPSNSAPTTTPPSASTSPTTTSPTGPPATSPSDSPTTPTGGGPGPTTPGPSPTTPGNGPSPPPTTSDPSPTTTTPVPPSSEPPVSKVIFNEDFSGRNRGWPVGTKPDRGTASYGGGQYDIQTNTPGNAYWAPAPVASSELVSSMTVTGRGRLVSPDQGGWGVWCLNQDGDRYEFLLSHEGNAIITGPGGGYLAEADNVVDPDKYHTITGTCSVDSGGIDLKMSVAGTALTASATGTARWTDVGVHGFSFSDVPDQPLGEAIFTSFRVEKAD